MKEINFNVTLLPSLNKLHGNRWAMLNWKKKYLKELRGYDTYYGLNKPVKSYVLITRYGTRLLDKDNLYGGCKPLIDALKELKLIWDDSPEYLQLEVLQEKSDKKITSVHMEDIK